MPDPAPAAAAKTVEPPRTVQPPEDSALALARSAGKPVEVESQRSETRQVWAKPDGTFTLEQYVRPVRVRKADGWVPVDTTLRLRPDGAVETVATAADLTFSGGGSGPLARMARGAKTLELGWQGTLPKPTLNGDTATYPEVMPGVDLQVTADVDGFSHVLVVKSRAAAAGLTELAYPLSATGLSVKTDNAGNLEAVDESGGTIFIAPTPKMWDSEGIAGLKALREGRSPEARESAMGVELAGRQLRLRPDKKMLADPKTKFPVYLDPYFSAARGSWTAVWKNWPSSNYLNSSDVARVGKISSTQTNRSFFQMNTGSTIHGKQIIKATLRTYETWSYSCSARKVEAWGTGAISKSTTWNNPPAKTRLLSTVNVAKGYGTGSCAPGGVEFDVTSWAADAAAKKWNTMTIGLYATSETDLYAWKKFKNNPVAVIEYNSIPSDPVAADAWSDPGGPCVSGDGRPVISTASPKLWAKLKDADNSVKGRFEWYNAAGTKTGEYVTATGSSGSAYYATIPVSLYADGALIRWRVRAEDGKANSAWSPWCEATVDATAPGREPVVTSPEYAEEGWNDGVGLAGTFKFDPNGVTDVAAYVYGLDTTPKSEVAPAADGTATIALTPRHDGPNVLSVRSKDRAGQLGPIRTYVFNVNSGKGPNGHWALDEGQGTVAADATGAHPATLYGATWTTGKTGMGLRLANAYAQTSGPIADTSRNFTVTAWARLTGNAATATVVTQEGSRTGGFTLQYSKSDDRWALVRASSDADGAATVKALSAAAPRLNEWTHLAGVYDSAAGQISLYVNGKLESTVAFTQPWNATGPLTIGRGKVNGAAAESWPGDVDEVRVYGRAMFADEVADLVNSAATLVGHWKLDEESGTSAAESSGRSTAATLAGGASWTDGWLDGALALDGVNGYAQTTGPAVGTRSSFTVAAWVQLDYLPTADTAAVAQPGSRAAGFQLGFDKEQQRWTLGMRAADTDTAALVRTRSDDIPNPLEWTHIAGVYDALAGELRIYVNGRLSTTTITSHASAWNATGPLQLGRTKTAGAFTGYWPGAVDDVRTYDGVLSAEQIAQLAAQ
ncbi:LamG-like jellyroll fold domain-containing protein [Nonomuraea angiospora]|uniref:LamG-like jellyroll fold domain-containing protein n=1 Tax=Nonomuraea angiospora TaxID=46172 RepID=UPI0029B235C6|nr:LamG-like jellyroll fold domain-containing protein [Nonomuraea angiospora]MDX3111188.1 DNRLRE domain-containing protein [Nonomuraea angiospora]